MSAARANHDANALWGPAPPGAPTLQALGLADGRVGAGNVMRDSLSMTS
jgi:hypothetical protein